MKTKHALSALALTLAASSNLLAAPSAKVDPASDQPTEKAVTAATAANSQKVYILTIEALG